MSTEPEVPPQTVPLVAQGDGSTSLWGSLFLPMGQGPDVSVPLPGWCPHGELLRDADPARFYAIDFLVWTLCFNFSQRLALAGKSVARPIPQAVMAVGLVDPIPFMTESSTEFYYPLLAVYRKSGRPGQVTSSYPFEEDRWEIRYVLPSLGFEAASRITPIFEAFRGAIVDMVWKGYHPQYAPPGGNLGDLVFKKAGMMEVETGDTSYEYVETEGGGIVHPMLRMEWDVKTRKMDVRTAPGATAVRGAPVPFSGTDVSIAVAAEGGDKPPNSPVPIVVLKTDGPGT
jgi:hypothetical protein